MRAIHIDSVNRVVKEVDLKNAYPEGNNLIDVGTITLGGEFIDENGIENSLYVDDEGLLKNPKVFFYCPLFNSNPLAGSGFIMGVDSFGETIAASLDLEDVKKNVQFFDLRNPEEYLAFRRLVR